MRGVWSKLGALGHGSRSAGWPDFSSSARLFSPTPRQIAPTSPIFLPLSETFTPAPYSDVVHLVLPTWPSPSTGDALLCSEVKTKSTDGASEPIKSAIEDCEKDRTTRLAKTLLWLRDRAITGSAEGASIAQLNRFIEAAGLPAAEKKFQAVSVVCESLVDGELADIPAQASSEFTVVVVAVPDLKNTYTAVFNAAKLAVPPAPAAPPAA